MPAANPTATLSALSTFCVFKAFVPTAVDSELVSSVPRALTPIATLLLPVVIASPAPLPTIVFSAAPTCNNFPELYPIAVLPLPVNI